jgi:hypothetical protein
MRFMEVWSQSVSMSESVVPGRMSRSCQCFAGETPETTDPKTDVENVLFVTVLDSSESDGKDRSVARVTCQRGDVCLFCRLV